MSRTPLSTRTIRRMRVAVIGAGISGLAAGYRLDPAADVVLYDAEPRAGGHAHTVLIREDGRDIPLDSGFLVFNERTYPGLVGLFAELGVAPAPVGDVVLGAVPALRARVRRAWPARRLRAAPQPAAAALRPAARRSGRFFRDAPRVLREAIWERRTIGDYLHARGFGHGVTNHFLAPMGAAIWSSTPERMRDMPARFFVNFFVNHGLLTLMASRPGTRSRAARARTSRRSCERLRGEVRLGAPVRSVRRGEDGVWVAAGDGPAERFDRVVIAPHPDQALRFLEDPSPAERDALVAHAVLQQRDDRAPRRRAAAPAPRGAGILERGARRLPRGRAAPDDDVLPEPPARLETATDYCVSLNSAAASPRPP